MIIHGARPPDKLSVAPIRSSVADDYLRVAVARLHGVDTTPSAMQHGHVIDLWWTIEASISKHLLDTLHVVVFHRHLLIAMWFPSLSGSVVVVTACAAPDPPGRVKCMCRWVVHVYGAIHSTSQILKNPFSTVISCFAILVVVEMWFTYTA